MSNISSLSIKTGLETKRKSSKGDVPFYEPPTGVPTSSQIIKEAREKLHDTRRGTVPSGQDSSGLIRTLGSNRPFTPREEKRTLFGPKSTRSINERPPSSFQIGSKSFELDNSSRPISATRLSPIDKPLKLVSQTSLDSELTNRNTDETTDILSVVTSPKISRSRLEPLEIPHDKIRSIQIKDKESNINGASKNRESSSATSTGSSTQNDTQVEFNWKNYIEPLLSLMTTYFQEKAVEKFCESCDKLNKLLESCQMNSKSSSKRSTILKIIFKYLDIDSDKMKLKISKIILNMKVSSNNLTNICRLLFSISRNTDNDVYFMEDDILDSILNSSKRLDFKENSDSVVYFSGTLKNLSENSRLLKQLSLKNVEDILLKIIKDLSKYYNNKETLKSEAGHALVQLTATLRNLADLSNTRQKLLNLNLIEELVSVLKYYTSDGELMLNVSRILSKLTLHSDCCQRLSSYESCYKSFIKIMLKHESKQDLIVRISFILGNLTSRHEESRVQFVKEKYSIDTLVKTLNAYYELDELHQKQNLDSIRNIDELNESEPNPNEDVMIKLVRVVANLAINEIAGSEIANRADVFEILLKILDAKDLSSEELTIDTIVTINNLSFYNSGLIVNISKNIIDSLMKYLLSNNNDAILEVFRVFANLSRHQSIRNYLIERKINILAVAYLNSNNRELIYIVIGVLINIMIDSENRFILKQEKGVKKLIDILNEIGPSDWQLSSMACKLLMNYSEKPKLSYSYFEQSELKILKNILIELLDEKFSIRKPNNLKNNHNKNENDDENLDEYMNYLWLQDFSPVASLLLKRVIEEIERK